MLITLAEELTNNPSRFVKLSHHLIWDIDQEQLRQDGEYVALAVKEHRLLKLFIQNSGKSASYDRTVDAVWDNALNQEISIESLKKQVSQLRKKTLTLIFPVFMVKGIFLNSLRSIHARLTMPYRLAP